VVINFKMCYGVLLDEEIHDMHNVNSTSLAVTKSDIKNQ